MSTEPKRKRRIMREMMLKEISAVDVPAQPGAVVALIKNYNGQSDILADAEQVAKGAKQPGYTRQQYEDAMLDFAKRHAAPGTSTAVAFARLCEQGSEEMTKLYTAARIADAAEQEAMKKNLANRDALHQKMVDHANANRQKGETPEGAFSRLMKDDATMQSLYLEYGSA